MNFLNKIALLFLVIIAYSCEQKQEQKSLLTNEQEGDVEMNALNGFVNNNSVTSANYVAYRDIAKISYEEAKNKYSPIDETTFFLNEGLSDLRVELYNFFPSDDISKKILISEATWVNNENNNLTVWYVEKDSLLTPIHHIVWDKITGEYEESKMINKNLQNNKIDENFNNRELNNENTKNDEE